MAEGLRDITVLVVHPDAGWRGVQGNAFRKAGAVVVELEGPAEARGAVGGGPVDAIVVGGHPDGAALTERLKATSGGVPILWLMSAEESDIGLRSGADLCLPKGAKPAEVVAAVRTLARLGSAERRAEAAGEEARECRRVLGEMERWRTALDAVLHQMPAGVVVFDREGEIILSNEAADRILLQPLRGPFLRAFAAGPEVHRPDGTRYGPDEIPGMRALRRGETVSLEEVRLRYPDGEERVAAISATPLRTAAGEAIGSVSLIRDITESRRAEEEREEQARLLETIQESVPVGLAYLDRQLRFRQVNSTFAQLAGLSEDEALGEGVLHTLKNSGEVGEALTRAQEAGEPFEAREVPVTMPQRPEAGTRYLDIGGAPVKHEGEVEGIVVAVSDVTSRVAQRRQIEEAERAWAGEAELLATIIDNTDNWLAYLDRDLRFVRVNRAYARNMGRPIEELVGQRFIDTFPKSLDIYGFLTRARDSGIAQRFWGVPRKLEYRPEAGRVYLHMALLPVKDEQGTVQGVVVSAVDVTQQTRSRNRMIAAERARAELAEHLGDEINHRVKNNLAMVSGLLQMQMLAAANPEVATALREALARVRTFASLHEQMYVSHGEDVEFTPVLQRIAKTADEVFGGRESVEISVAADAVTVSSRAATNLSVIANELITNALKHGAPGDDGVLRVEVTIHRGGGYLELRVQNSGNPVPIGFDVEANAGMGLRLVRDLVVTGYHGWFALRRSDGGTVAEVKIDALAVRGENMAERIRREREGKAPE